MLCACARAYSGRRVPDVDVVQEGKLLVLSLDPKVQIVSGSVI